MLLVICVCDYWNDYTELEILWYILFVITLISMFIWDVIVDWGLS